MNLSDYIMEFLHSKGMRNAFMLPGGGNAKILLSLLNSKINAICCHHEMACGFAAEAYSKFTNDFIAVFSTTGPGSTHLMSALIEAYVSNVPVLFISGQVKSDQTVYRSGVSNIRQVGVQEIDILPSVMPLTKYAQRVYDSKMIKYYLEKSLFIAKSGRPGPVWIEIPIDIQGESVDVDSLIPFDPSELEEVKIEASDEEIDFVVQKMHNSKRPIIVAGHGICISSAVSELESLLETISVPCVTTNLGKDLLSSDMINNIGTIGFRGTRPGNIAVQNADLVISIGSRLCIASTGYASELFARNATLIAVDIDAIEHQKSTVKCDYIITCDAKHFLNKLSKKLNTIKPYSSWLQTCASYKVKYPVCKKEFAKNYSDGLNPYFFIEYITKNIDSSVPIVTDAGTAFIVGAQTSFIRKGQRYITSSFGSMGYGLPASIGISYAINKNKVVVFTGDGSIQQNLQELQTIVHNKLPIKIFILNNDGYTTMRQSANKDSTSNFLYDCLKKLLSFPNFERLSNAYGIKYFKIDMITDLQSNEFMTLLSSEDPIVFEVMTTNDLDIYTVSTFHNANGTISARPLEDMFPYLDESELKDIMQSNYFPRS